MAARGEEAQAQKARGKAEKREAKGRETEAQTEERRIKEAVAELVNSFRGSLEDTIRLAVTKRLRPVKEEREKLREVAQAYKKLADDRRNELDGQVERARAAEAEAKSFKEQLGQACREAGIKSAKARQEHSIELARHEEIIEEQASTIKAQAVALREAHRKAKG